MTKKPLPTLIMVADPGPDPDDVKGILLAAHYHTKKRLRLVGVICCAGGQAKERTQLARRILELTFPKVLKEVPVVVGANNADKVHAPAPHEYDIEGYAATKVPETPTGVELLHKVLRDSEDATLTVEIQASFTDVAAVMRDSPALFKRKVVRVCAMGGVKDPAAEAWEADEAFNNDLDKANADSVYQFCQKEGVPISVLGRNAVPPLGMQEMRTIANRTKHPVMNYLSNAQDSGLVALWDRVCQKKLPARCTKEWFFTTFCGVSAEQFAALGPDDVADGIEIRSKLNGTVKPYDPMTVMLALDRADTAQWFKWGQAEVKGPGGTLHHFFQTPETVFSEAVLKNIIDTLASVATAGTSSGCQFQCM